MCRALETPLFKFDTHYLFIHILVVMPGPTEIALGIILSCLVSCAFKLTLYWQRG